MYPETFRSILVIKPGAIGDLLQITPTIRALKRRFPEAEITVLVGLDGTRSLFEHSPHVAEVLAYDRKGGQRGWSGLLRFLHTIYRHRFDLVINFQRSRIVTWLITLAARPRRVLVYKKAHNRQVHAVVNHLETVAPLGIELRKMDYALELYLTEADEQNADAFLEQAGLAGRKLVAFNPGASNLIKCWPPHKFAQLATRLQQELQLAVLVVGGPYEAYLYDAMAADMDAPPLNLVGKTSLLTLGALLKRTICLVSGDTGPLHVATAVGTPVVALFGAIDPARTGPVGDQHIIVRHPELPCVPCMAKTCTNPVYLECMERIGVDEVFAAIRRFL